VLYFFPLSCSIPEENLKIVNEEAIDKNSGQNSQHRLSAFPHGIILRND
jgi:hypothetical protein